MKNASVFLRAGNSTNPKAPVLYGTVYIPATLVQELVSQLAAGQYDPRDVDKTTGEARYGLKVSLWRETDPSKNYVLSGSVESPSETAAYEASKAANGLIGPPRPYAAAAGSTSPHQAAIAQPRPVPAAAVPPQAQPPAWGAPAANGWG